jgi:uncharacterized membrane protein YqhA
MDREESMRWVTAAVAVVLIVLLVLFARGPEGQDRSGATLPVAAVLTTA